MAITSGFFMSIAGDRKYKADFFAQYFATFIGNGVFPNPATNLQIIANDDMTVTVKPGKGWINGYVVFNDDDYILSIDPADGVLNRIDRIILRWDSIDREIKALVKQGAFASAPVAPSLQRDADAYELAIADIAVNKGVTSITQTNITDLRLNKELCGIVHGVVNQVDTTAVFNQFENWYKQTKADYDADMKTWTQEKKDAFNLWYTTNTNEFAERFDAWFNANTTNWDAGFTDWFEEVRGRLTEDPATDILNQLMLHEETTIMSEGGVHDIRVADKSFQYFDGEEWITVNEGFKVGNTSGFKAQARSGLKIEIEFGDPSDSTIIDKNGDVVVLAEWAGTQLRAKKDSYPVDENDGILLVDSKVKNQFKDTPFIHDGLTNGEEWFYMAFPYTKNKVFTIDSANRGSAVATNKLNQPAPAAPTISNLKFDRVTVTGDNLVSLDKVNWFASPHTFTGLTEETSYTAYAKKKETAEFLESPISVGRAFKTPSDLPGPSDLIAGDMQAGYFGVVPASELFTGPQIASAVGITQGTAQFNDVGWLKFAIDGKVIYKSQKPYRHTISWDDINAKGCVDGTKQITKDGTTFKVRLMKGALTDPRNYTASDRGAKGSEWNRLMLPIHVKAKDKSWAYPAYVESTIPYWGIDFTDADLQTHYNHGNGSYHWCQEVFNDNASYRVLRGNDGVSFSTWYTPSLASSDFGWSPILEVIS